MLTCLFMQIPVVKKTPCFRGVFFFTQYLDHFEVIKVID